MSTPPESNDGLRLKRPAWSRQTYEMVAAALKRGLDQAGVAAEFTKKGYAAAYLELADTYADTFAADNPAFNRARFLKACGVTE